MSDSNMRRPETFKGRRAASGFTLIELMIVVVVIGILAAIVYPNYTDQVRKSRRGQVKADMAEYMALAERFHTVNNTYVGFALPSAVSPREGGTARYGLASTTQTQSVFVITATANGDQANDACGNLSLSQAGVKTNSTGALSDCW